MSVLFSHSNDDSCFLDVIEDLHSADDVIDKDVRVTDSDVGFKRHDVHIGCLIWIHISDDLCLSDGAVELLDELVEIGDDQRDVKDEVGFDVVGDIVLKVADEVLDVGFEFIADVWSNVYEVDDVQLRLLMKLNADDRVGDGLVEVVVHDANHSEVAITDVKV